ncbi:hypothetical protein ENBRE01_2861 [Enteropsectra breve]|nr:hypothetical protein ENBRE01_2861 [Enteropsectra breve]
MDFTNNTVVPSTFENRETIKIFLYEYNIMNQRRGRIRQSNHSAFVMACSSDTCTFFFKATKTKNGSFMLKTFMPHNCIVPQVCIKSSLIAKHVQDVDRAVSTLSTRECISYLQNTKGIHTDYHKAYAGLKLLKKAKITADKNSFALIEPWLSQLILSQEGTKTDYQEKTTDSGCREFEYCALIPAISVTVVQNSLPIIALDACHTKGKYKGMIMIATAVTGQDKGFIIGYAIPPQKMKNIG